MWGSPHAASTRQVQDVGRRVTWSWQSGSPQLARIHSSNSSSRVLAASKGSGLRGWVHLCRPVAQGLRTVQGLGVAVCVLGTPWLGAVAPQGMSAES